MSNVGTIATPNISSAMETKTAIRSSDLCQKIATAVRKNTNTCIIVKTISYTARNLNSTRGAIYLK